MSLAQLSRLLPLPNEELQQILDYAATLPKPAAAEHLSNLLGDSPQAVDFISTFNSKRRDAPAPSFQTGPASSSAPSSSRNASGGRGGAEAIEPVPKSTRGGKKKAKAPLHVPQAREVRSSGPSPGTAYRKGDDAFEYIPTSASASTSRKPTPSIPDPSQSRSQTHSPAPAQAPSKPPPPETKAPAPRKPQQAGFLISDHPPPKKQKSAASSRSSTPKTANTKISIAGGTPMKGASTALTDLDSAIRALEVTSLSSSGDSGSRACNCVATRHPLQSAAPNCMSCGKVICVKEGLGPCTSCGAPLLTDAEIDAILKELKAERAREKQAADRAAHKRPDISRTPAPFTAPRDAFPPVQGSSGSTTPSLTEAEAKAREHRDRLLSYQAQNARRTTVRDEVADFDVTTALGGAGSMWASPSERALELKRQQKVLRELEWEMKPEYEKRRQVVSIDLVGGKVVKKMVAVERPPTPEDEEQGEEWEHGEGSVLREGDGNKGGGAFSRNPLLGAMIKPVYKDVVKGKGRDNGDGVDVSRSRWRRVQDDMDDNEGVILDGGAYGHAKTDVAGFVEAGGDEPACG